MGKKAKKTRWRALTLNGHRSDSEESAPNQRKYSKFFYSSHSSPVRKFQNESSKTTRSNSTTSEQKATFNEDEYTRITTPRQDVLFKKGYLNKPKSYQTQTSTGTNSTSTCTPDHQSADGTEGTDLEYESQLVFPNGFIDHNGIYYINSFEPFPFVVYNAPICYPEFPRTKRYSTDSLTESVSPHNEKSGINHPSDEPVSDGPRRQKKRRRRKISRSKSITSQESTDSSEEEAKTYSLKPDAEEFIPRNLRAPEAYAFEPSVQFVNIQPNFIPVPFINELQRPPLLPINFVPSEPAFVNVIPTPVEEPVAVEKKKSDVDIAKIVLKLEEAAKQQKRNFARQRVKKPGEAQKRAKIQVVEVAPQARAPAPRSPRKTNQWISVSSRRKRRNKIVVDEEVDEEPPQSDELFESFDVELLVDVVPPPAEPVEPVEPTPEPVEPTPEPVIPAPEPKKKKKKAPKIPPKRVMVIDPPLPQPPKPEEPARVVETPAPEEKKPQVVKKKKKKKQLPAPLENLQSVSSSNTTLNGDESYEFLIENSILEEFEQKTNVEVSHELDRMIQKGIYTHLEEKIRALNLSSNDEFFLSADGQLPPQASTSKLAWNSHEFLDKGEDYQNTSINLTRKNFSVSPEPILNASPSRYPITRAVKEWMTRTRENTPDVEILKSPNAIFKEFYESDGDDEDETIWSAPVVADEVVETYESSYGKNADYLKIKDEVEAHTKSRRHGDLPYRAICCNLM